MIFEWIKEVGFGAFEVKKNHRSVLEIQKEG